MEYKIFVYAIYEEDEDLMLVGIKNLRKITDLEVLNSFCVVVNIKDKVISKPSYYLQHLKFQDWLELNPDVTDKYIQKIYETFGPEEIEEKIIKSLNDRYIKRENDL